MLANGEISQLYGENLKSNTETTKNQWLKTIINFFGN